MNPKSYFKRVLPTNIKRFIKRRFYGRFKHSIEWEYMPEGWHTQEIDADIKGWNQAQVLETYKLKWPLFEKAMSESGPLGISHEAIEITNCDPTAHNMIMSFAYAFTLATRNSTSVSMLDWGGGIGHYYLLSQALIPELTLDYYCKDLPIFTTYGQELFPDAHFFADESHLNRQYDFVLASGSLQYSVDWKTAVNNLARVTGKYLFITRIPIVEKADSFVFVQRPYYFGYDTEYLGWCLNRKALLRQVEATGLTLVREFITGESPYIYNAPEQNKYLGFLFQKPKNDP